MIRVLLVHSKQRGIKYWFAAMEPSLIRLLQLNHFNFRPIGPMVDYYGQVMPCIASMIEIEKQMMENNKDFYLQFAKHLMDPTLSEIEETMWPPPGFVLP
jgi:N-acyl amino acid synthase of PEP-CTERM/exosortase system